LRHEREVPLAVPDHHLMDRHLEDVLALQDARDGDVLGVVLFLTATTKLVGRQRLDRVALVIDVALAPWSLPSGAKDALTDLPGRLFAHLSRRLPPLVDRCLRWRR